MKNQIGRIILLVHDYDECAAFYEEALGFHKIFDKTSENGKRYLHLAPSKVKSTGIWFLKAETEEQKEAVGKQTQGAPTFVLYTDAFEEMHRKMEEQGVTINKGPEESKDSLFLHFADLYGNEIIMVQMKT